MLDTTFLDLMTRKHFEPAMRNQIYNKFVLWQQLSSKGKVKTATGTGIEWNIVTREHEAIGLLSGYDTLLNNQINPVGRAFLEPAFYYATVGISKQEEIQNSGSTEKLLDMISTRFDNARQTLGKRLQLDAFGDGEKKGGYPVIIGLDGIISASNVYAGINRSDSENAFWRSYVDSTTHTLVNLMDPTKTSYMPRIMRKAYTSATFDNSPNLIITTKDIFNLYQDIAGDKLRIDNEMADLGFGGAEFQGGAVKMTFDDYCPAGKMYFLTLADFSLYIYPGMNFQIDGWKELPDQAAKQTHIFWFGQLKCDCPREQAVITTIQTS